jgi:hypothetical protein
MLAIATAAVGAHLLDGEVAGTLKRACALSLAGVVMLASFA